MGDADQVRWGQQLAHDGVVTFPTRRRKMSLVLLGCLGFTAIGAFLLALHEGPGMVVAGSASVVFFGVFGIPTLSWRLVTRKPVVRVDRDGVSAGELRAAWSEIERVRVWSFYGTSVVILELSPQVARRISENTRAPKRWLDRMNQSLVGPATLALPSGNGFDPHAMAEWLDSLRASTHGQRGVENR